jgi:hypothetical protein
MKTNIMKINERRNKMKNNLFGKIGITNTNMYYGDIFEKDGDELIFLKSTLCFSQKEVHKYFYENNILYNNIILV